jgi:RHS repeat-associated protein
VADARRDRRYGGLIERREVVVGEATTSVIARHIPGLGGIVASRRGVGGPWVFPFGEARGNRFFTDTNGSFVQDVRYEPYGEAHSTGRAPGAADYTHAQWNGGDALVAFELMHLGARLYDPVIGHFLSRDPLVVPGTAAKTNPYAFALNDPQNRSDPSGLQSSGSESRPDPPIFPWSGGSSGSSTGATSGGDNPQAPSQEPTPTDLPHCPTPQMITIDLAEVNPRLVARGDDPLRIEDFTLDYTNPDLYREMGLDEGPNPLGGFLPFYQVSSLASTVAGLPGLVRGGILLAARLTPGAGLARIAAVRGQRAEHASCLRSAPIKSY